jgi:hypothetical protein
LVILQLKKGGKMIDERMIKNLSLLKKKIDDGKTERDKTKGMLDANLKAIENKFGCKTLEEAEKELAKIKAKLEKLESVILQDYEELKAKYDW